MQELRFVLKTCEDCQPLFCCTLQDFVSNRGTKFFHSKIFTMQSDIQLTITTLELTKKVFPERLKTKQKLVDQPQCYIVAACSLAVAQGTRVAGSHDIVVLFL